VVAIRLYNDALDNFVGYWDTPDGIAATPYGRNKNLGKDGNLAFRTADWRNGMIYTDRNATAPTKVSPGRYRVVVAAQKKFSQGVYPVDFEVYQVAVITIG
jgi:hypothetical protein